MSVSEERDKVFSTCLSKFLGFITALLLLFKLFQGWLIVSELITNKNVSS